MRRLALLLAASLMGTGCIVSSDTSAPPPCLASTITVRWPSFMLANGGVTSSCQAAGVTFVDVFLNDQPVQQSIPCGTGGLTITSPPAGNSRITVEGVDASGTILLRDEQVAAPVACGDVVVDAQPAEGTFQLAYFFTGPSNVCNPGSYIWFLVHDDIANATAAVVDGTANTTAYPCSSAIQFPLPIGNYTVQRVEEVVPVSTGYGATATNCSPNAFSLAAATTGGVNVGLTDTNAFCP